MFALELYNPQSKFIVVHSLQPEDVRMVGLEWLALYAQKLLKFEETLRFAGFTEE